MAVLTVIAFIAVCEIVLFLARRSPLVAKLYGLGYLVKTDRREGGGPSYYA